MDPEVVVYYMQALALFQLVAGLNNAAIGSLVFWYGSPTLKFPMTSAAPLTAGGLAILASVCVFAITDRCLSCYKSEDTKKLSRGKGYGWHCGLTIASLCHCLYAIIISIYIAVLCGADAEPCMPNQAQNQTMGIVAVLATCVLTAANVACLVTFFRNRAKVYCHLTGKATEARVGHYHREPAI